MIYLIDKHNNISNGLFLLFKVIVEKSYKFFLEVLYNLLRLQHELMRKFN